jgi:hypothetical protein
MIDVFSTRVVSLSAVTLNCSAYLSFEVYRYYGRFDDSNVVVVNIAIEFVRSIV